MRYPAPSDYQEALQDPGSAFPDPDLAGGEVAAGPLGLPRATTGAFAVVFRVETATGPVAVRCFLVDVPDRQARYRALARRFEEGGLPEALTPFGYRREGIRVGGEVYPVVTMPWVEGEPLDTYVAARLADPHALRALAEAWRELLRDLERAGVAHGDLQHGNVLVAGDGPPSLRLVDYDAAFVPALAGRPGTEVGHRNYQHPDRTDADFGPWLDRFPGLAVYTALLALADRPDLWERFSTGENLLFQASDYYDPSASALFAELAGVPAVGPLAEGLARACYLRPDQVPPLEAVLGGEAVADGPRTRRAQPGEARRVRREGAARWVGPSVLAGLALGAVLAGAGEWALALVVAWAALGVAGVAAARAYAGLPAVRRRRRLRREAVVLERWIAELEDERQGLLRQRLDLAGRADRLREERLRELQAEVLDRGLRHHFVGELSGVDAVGHVAVVRLKGAGVRTASQATPVRVAAVRGLTSDQRGGIDAWRADLAGRYGADVPEALSPGEEQRMRRLFERRVEAFDADLARLVERQAVQRGELSRVRAQEAGLPEVTPLRFLAHLLRLSPLPEGPSSPPGALPEEAPAPAPRPAPPERPWWTEPPA